MTAMNSIVRSVIVLLAGLVPAAAQDGAESAPMVDIPFPEMRLAKPARGAGIIGALGNRMGDVARYYQLSEEELGKLCLRDGDLGVDTSGRLQYICAGGVAEAPTAQNAATDALLSYPESSTFVLHSKPGKTRVIYLDFNGHVTSGTSWLNGGTFTSPAYDTDGNPGAFSSAELAAIQEIWKRVSEDYAPWEVDVTTEEPPLEWLRKTASTDTAYGIRMVIGGSSYDWFGQGAGGVAYLNSFSWNSDTPAFVFPAQLGNGFPKYVAEAVSHEAGHTVSLSHDGVAGGSAYYAGHANWAPIMGVGYYKEVTQFSKGEYTGANNTEDDTAKIATFIPRSPDFAGNDIITAVAVGGTTVSATGIIESAGDADLYRVDAGAGTLTVTAVTAVPDANLDITLSLYDGTGTLLGSANPATLGSTLAATVPGGTYYLAVDGTGVGTGSTGYTDYASLGQFTLNGTVAAPVGLPPVVSVGATVPASGLAVSFSSAGSSDPDGGVLAYDWDFGDGGSSAVANPSYAYGAAGTYTVSLVVTDASGLSRAAATTVTVQVPLSVVYVAGITMSKVVSGRGTQARAVVTVRDGNGNLRPNITVTGTWSSLTSSKVSGVTGSAGTVTLSSGVTKANGTFVFTVTGMSGGGYTYNPALNTVTSGSIVK
jgi:PKD repeat protein